MLPLIEARTLFQGTIERLEGLFPPERTLVVTVAEQAAALQKQAAQIPAGNYLLEPEARGTASVVGLAAVAVQERDAQAVLAVLPSDHYIRNRDLFHHILRVALEVACKDYLVTLGITPTYPATAYGYIERGDPLPEQYAYPVYRVCRFKEKPDEAEARTLVARGDHSWNSGMFIWRADAIMKSIARHMPELKSALDTIAEAWGTPRQQAVLQAVWPGLAVETVDYGVMERAENVAVLPAGGLGWSDVGSWDSLFDVLMPDADGNIVFSGQHISIDTDNSLVYGNRDKRLIVTIGVDDLIIVDSGDVLLVCRKDQTQKVRQVVAHLKDSDREHYT